MLFNSFEFIFLYLPIVFLVYFFLIKKKIVIGSKVWLILSSLFFYSWWNIVYLPLIISSVLFNFVLTRKIFEIAGNKGNLFTKKRLLLIGLIFNIGLLGYFKYMDFFIFNINMLTSSQIDFLHLALPLGISFYTLQQIAYLVDSYEGLVKRKSFLDYSLFVLFFPQLIAGPIVHYKEVMPQFASLQNKILNYKNIILGMFIFSIGLFKKVVLADTFATWVHKGYDTEYILSFLDSWTATLAYTFQLYFDFSGYTDMAIGVALLFNIKLPQNFNSPLKATGMIDYWKRWHITLTNFITSYIYTPIVRSFTPLTFNKAMLATIIVFLISGMWHGSGWTFIFWGFLHGTGVVINHYWHKKTKIRLPKYIAWFITFIFLNIGNVFFRSNSFEQAWRILQSMFDTSSIMVSKDLLIFLHDYHISEKLVDFLRPYSSIDSFVGIGSIFMIIIGFIIVLSFKNTKELFVQFSTLKVVPIGWFVWSIVLMGFSLMVMSFQTSTEFLYFDF